LFVVGVVCYKLNNYEKAKEYFEHALLLCKHLPKTLMITWEATYCNLGHCCRKLKLYDDAIIHYETALGLCPKRASTYTSLGFVNHMNGDLNVAIERYCPPTHPTPPFFSVTGHDLVSVDTKHYEVLVVEIDTQVQFFSSFFFFLYRYHQALGLRPSDTFASDMLKRALEESLDETNDWMKQIPMEP
jgi:tetratricopeptide (TPR) repeat protein